MGKSINVTLQADTGAFVSNVASMTAATKRLRDETDQTKQNINNSYLEQIKAAKAVNASNEELTAITKRTAEMRAQAEQEYTTKVEALQSFALSRRTQKFQAAARDKVVFEQQMAEQTRAAQQQALRSDIQERNLSQNAGFLARLFGSSSNVAGELQVRP